MHLLFMLSFLFFCTLFSAQAAEVFTPDEDGPAIAGDGSGDGSSGDNEGGQTGGGGTVTNPPPPVSEPEPEPEPEPETNVAEAIERIHDILDAIESIVSQAQGPAAPTATITSPAALPTAADPCLSASSIYSLCNRGVANFTTQDITQQASCLCYEKLTGYSTATWVPGIFDGYLSSCNAYVNDQTLVSTSVSGLTEDLAICTSLGPVRDHVNGTVTSTTATSTPLVSTPTQRPPTSGGSRRYDVPGLPIMVATALLVGVFE